MQSGNFPSDREQRPMGTAMSIEDVVSALAERGCPDLTSELESTPCSTVPIDGGGYCDVYRGEVANRKKIAIKCLRLFDRPGQENDSEKILKRAVRELYGWSKLEHPNVLPLMGLAIFRGQLSMISEWMENGNLVKYVSLNPNADRVELSLDVCTGLMYLHSNDIVHGDLKAANVLVSHGGTAMLADFGNSQLKDLTFQITDTTTSGLSLRWAAPELLLEDSPNLTKKADVYACGMTIFETLTGKIPYDDCSDEQVMFLVGYHQETPTRPAFGMSDEIWEILQQCWKPSPERPEIARIKEQLVQFRAPPAGTTGDQGQSREAEAAGTSAQVRGEDHPDGVLPASMLGDQGQSLQAETTGTPVKALGETLPDGVPPTSAVNDQGQSREAEAAETSAQVRGEDHPNSLQSIACLAATNSKQLQLVETEPLEAQAVSPRKQIPGEDHPDTSRNTRTRWMAYVGARLYPSLGENIQSITVVSLSLLLLSMLVRRKRWLSFSGE